MDAKEELFEIQKKKLFSNGIKALQHRCSNCFTTWRSYLKNHPKLCVLLITFHTTLKSNKLAETLASLKSLLLSNMVQPLLLSKKEKHSLRVTQNKTFKMKLLLAFTF